MSAAEKLFTAIRESVESLRQHLVNAPTSEWGVIFLLGQLSSQGKFNLVKGNGGFPDCILDVQGTQLSVELEHRSSQYIRHGHPIYGCDAVICWENDTALPLPVLALKQLYPNTATPDIATINLSNKHPALADIFEYLRKWIAGYGIPSRGVPVRSETNTLTFLWGRGSLCSIQFCGHASNEYVRFRFYRRAFPSESVANMVVALFTKLSGPHIAYSPSKVEERLDLFPDAWPQCPSVVKELDLLVAAITKM